MKIKSLLTIFIVVLIMTHSIRTSFPFSLIDEFKNEKTREWTTKELEDNLPEHIKKIIADNKLISWGEHSTIYCLMEKSSLFILITYVEENEFFKSNLIIERKDGLDFLSIYPDLWKNNFYIEKKAEVFFSSETGELVWFKFKINANEWVTIYEQTKI